MSEQASIRVLIPTPLRRYTGGEGRVTASGETVGDLLDSLDRQYPGLKAQICDDDGRIRRFVNVFVNGRNVRDADGEETPLRSGDEVGVMPAMAGGAVAVRR
ncbi:MAG TPA: ubiquitin-like small modifier protein 1 [Thermomicrobiales bacterium]|nr:ubiquitin-like small modifier protein 1 [Thermomicrobiales bacterium]